MSGAMMLIDRLDAIDAHLEILSGVFERLSALRADIERGGGAIAVAQLQIDSLRNEIDANPKPPR